jgi:perosamine synthetase
MAFAIEHTVVKLPSDQEASGRTLGLEEIDLLQQAIASGTLTSTKGRFVRQLELRFAAKLGVRYAYACASGSAAIHTAIAAIDPEPGEEIITSPITDMGALTPILYQGAVPVFAEVDPRTCNITARAIEPCLSDRTRAIVVTHLFGNPCEMKEIMELADSHGIPVIEDCAQALLAKYDNRFVGTIGRVGCFSLQQGKHITTGEGGLIVTNDETLARRMFLFINKAWGYGDTEPDHYFLALNYRMSELQGAVGTAQLSKLDSVVAKRIAAAKNLDRKLRDIPGIETPYVSPRSVHTYWKYGLRVNASVIPGGAASLAERLRARQITCAPRYIQKPAFQCAIFAKQKTFGNSRYPFTLARPEAIDYSPSRFPSTFEALAGVLVLPWNEHYNEEHLQFMANSIRESASELL